MSTPNWNTQLVYALLRPADSGVDTDFCVVPWMMGYGSLRVRDDVVSIDEQTDVAVHNRAVYKLLQKINPRGLSVCFDSVLAQCSHAEVKHAAMYHIELCRILSMDVSLPPSSVTSTLAALAAQRHGPSLVLIHTLFRSGSPHWLSVVQPLLNESVYKELMATLPETLSRFVPLHVDMVKSHWDRSEAHALMIRTRALIAGDMLAWDENEALPADVQPADVFSRTDDTIWIVEPTIVNYRRLRHARHHVARQMQLQVKVREYAETPTDWLADQIWVLRPAKDPQSIQNNVVDLNQWESCVQMAAWIRARSASIPDRVRTLMFGSNRPLTSIAREKTLSLLSLLSDANHPVADLESLDLSWLNSTDLGADVEIVDSVFNVVRAHPRLMHLRTIATHPWSRLTECASQLNSIKMFLREAVDIRGLPTTTLVRMTVQFPTMDTPMDNRMNPFWAMLSKALESVTSLEALCLIDGCTPDNDQTWLDKLCTPSIRYLRFLYTVSQDSAPPRWSALGHVQHLEIDNAFHAESIRNLMEECLPHIRRLETLSLTGEYESFKPDHVFTHPALHTVFIPDVRFGARWLDVQNRVVQMRNPSSLRRICIALGPNEGYAMIAPLFTSRSMRGLEYVEIVNHDTKTTTAELAMLLSTIDPRRELVIGTWFPKEFESQRPVLTHVLESRPNVFLYDKNPHTLPHCHVYAAHGRKTFDQRFSARVAVTFLIVFARAVFQQSPALIYSACPLVSSIGSLICDNEIAITMAFSDACIDTHSRFVFKAPSQAFLRGLLQTAWVKSQYHDDPARHSNRKRKIIVHEEEK